MTVGTWCFDLSRKCPLDETTGPLVAVASLAVTILTLFGGVGVAVWVYLRQERLTKQISSMQTELAWNSRRDEIIEKLRTEPDEEVARRRLREAERSVHGMNPGARIFSHDLVDLHRAYWVNPAVRLPNADNWPEYHEAISDIATSLSRRFPPTMSCFDLLDRVKPFLTRLADGTSNLPWEAISVFSNRPGFDRDFVQVLLRDAPQLARVISSLAGTGDIDKFEVIATGLADALRYDYSKQLDGRAADSFGPALCDISQSNKFARWLMQSDQPVDLLAQHLRCISMCVRGNEHYLRCKAVHECVKHVPMLVLNGGPSADDHSQLLSDLLFARRNFEKWNSTKRICSYCADRPTRDVALDAISSLEGSVASAEQPGA